jgi:hypothetical protein
MMKTFVNIAAQGDMLIRRIDVLPNDVKLVNSENGKYVLAHSETGHNHIVLERPTVKMYDSNDPFVSYLTVSDEPSILEHERSFDTHESIQIPAGTYEIRRQREYIAEGFRRAAD